MPFTPEALDFLVENQFHDSRSWYHEHKDVFKEKVIQPFVELIDGLQPAFDKLDSRIQCNPRFISRLYRDARRCRGKSAFRDCLWVTFRPTAENDYTVPSFYFEFSPRGFDMGCGYYNMTTDSRDALRELILSGHQTFTAALEAYESQSDFKLYGELYKRNHYPEQEERVADWLNRKKIGMSAWYEDFELFFSDRLVDFASEKFLSLKPFWELLCETEVRATTLRV